MDHQGTGRKQQTEVKLSRRTDEHIETFKSSAPGFQITRLVH